MTIVILLKIFYVFTYKLKLSDSWQNTNSKWEDLVNNIHILVNSILFNVLVVETSVEGPPAATQRTSSGPLTPLWGTSDILITLYLQL